jgi:hypothetical protein
MVPVMKRNAAPEFLPTNLREIVESLPTPRSKRHSDLLPQVLREWRNELQEHLSRESAATTRPRLRGLESIKTKAGQLVKALDAIDRDGQLSIVCEMVENRRRLDSVTRSFNTRARDFSDQNKRLKEQRDYLAQLAAISPKRYWHTGRGRPRNLAAYLVLRDAAAIYEWFSGKKAARVVSHRKESGPFFRFASTLWPIIFEKGCAGLPAAMKNWADGRRKYSERSPFIANLAMHNSSWRIFDR